MRLCAQWQRATFGTARQGLLSSARLSEMSVAAPLSQATGYGAVVGIGLLFAVAMMAVTKLLQRYMNEEVSSSIFSFPRGAAADFLFQPNRTETFFVSGRSVGTGLTAAAVISSWAWTTALLSSATVTFNFGVRCGVQRRDKEGAKLMPPFRQRSVLVRFRLRYSGIWLKGEAKPGSIELTLLSPDRLLCLHCDPSESSAL